MSVANAKSRISRLLASTALVAQVSSKIFPDFIPSTSLHPGIIYQDVSDKINRKSRQSVISLRSFAASKSQAETINQLVYPLFDSSTKYIIDKSSSLCIDSVHIITNAVSGFDDQTKLWYRAFDFQVLWHYAST